MDPEERQAQGELLDPDEVATRLQEVVQKIATQMALPAGPAETHEH